MSPEPRCRHGNIRSAEPCRDCDERDALRARIDELSRAYAGQGLALEEMTDERDRYLEALTTLEVQAVPEIAPDWVGIPTVEFDAAMRILKEPTK